jgi:hypothetical protein
MTDSEALHAALDIDPTDAAARLALADWCEEQSDLATAAAWRWLARQGKRPYNWSLYPDLGIHFTGYDWHNGAAHWDVPAYCTIPRTLWDLLPVRGHENTDSWRSYPTRREAEEALVEAFRLAVTSGWQPESDFGNDLDAGLLQNQAR